MAPLTNPRHEAFAQGVAKGLSADEAYQAAGYKPNRGNAIRLKANESIAARIEAIVKAGAARAEIDIARTLKEMVRLGTSDIRRLFDGNGALRPLHDLDDDTAAAIASVEVITKRLPGIGDDPPEIEYVHKIKMWDKNSALEKIGKHLGMFIDRLDHTSSDGTMTPKPVTINMTPQEAAEAYAAAINPESE
jgi:phage terminase small subunit